MDIGFNTKNVVLYFIGGVWRRWWVESM